MTSSSDFQPDPAEPGLPDLRDAVMLRKLADFVRTSAPRPTYDQAIASYVDSRAIHVLADGLEHLANEIDPPKRTPRPPFDEVAARTRLAGNRAFIDDLRGEIA